MLEYQIEVTEEAKADLYYYTVFERKLITEKIRVQLTHQPLIETKNTRLASPVQGFLGVQAADYSPSSSGLCR